MNKEHFNQLVGDYSKLDDQFKELEKLMHEFPYSQPVRMLNIKSSSILSKEEFQQRLALAAFYTTDRTVLRSLIEDGKVPGDTVVSKPATQIKPRKKTARKTKPQPSTTKSTSSAIDAEALRKEVLENLALLQQQKTSFLKLSELEEEKKEKINKTKAKKSPVKAKSPTPKVAPKSKPKVREAANSPRRVKKKELIDKFIADEPRITPKKVMKENQSDLSKASSELKEDLVSENLAVIFARQGKSSKAIDIYKKLIWKFPQKKASFAAQIEELKKKKG